MSTKQRKAKLMRQDRFDERSIGEYSVFRMFDFQDRSSSTYYYGGGIYNEDEHSLELFPDCIRPNRKSIPLGDVSYMIADNNCCDIMLTNNTWISGLKVPKIKSKQCCFQRMLFNDHRIIVPYNNYLVVNLHLLSIDNKSKVKFLRGVPLSTEIIKYKNPLTFAYTKSDNKVFVTYWDIINQKPVGEPCEFSGTLDIFA